MSDPSAQLEHAPKFSVELAVRRIAASAGGDAKQTALFSCGSASIERVWVQGYVQLNPKKMNFVLADSHPAQGPAGAVPQHEPLTISTTDTNTIDVYTTATRPRDIPPDQWGGLGLAAGDYVLVVGKLKLGRKGASQEGATPQAARLGITAHKVLVLPGDASAWHAMWMAEVAELHAGMYVQLGAAV